MEESRVLEAALESCHLLQRSLYASIREVRRLNVRYNLEWFIENYHIYVANIWEDFQIDDGKEWPSNSEAAKSPQLTGRGSSSKLSLKSQKSSSELTWSARSYHELHGSNSTVNYKFLKIKRGMEALLVQLHNAIEISNRQRNFMHITSTGREKRIRVCSH